MLPYQRYSRNQHIHQYYTKKTQNKILVKIGYQDSRLFMGNCIAVQNKVIKVVKTDGEVLEFKAPMKVDQVLSEYVDHAISDRTLPVVRHLRRDTEMIGGQLYYLLPLPLHSLKTNKRKLSYSNQEVTEAGEGSSGVLRVKLVVSKQELEAMLKKGRVSVGDLLSQLQEKLQSSKRSEELHDGNCEGWKPVLESIPEVY